MTSRAESDGNSYSGDGGVTTGVGGGAIWRGGDVSRAGCKI